MAAKTVEKARRKSTQEVSKLLESLADMVVDSAKKGSDPRMDIPVRALSNVAFNKKSRIIELGKSKTARTFFNLGMAKKFMQTMLVADALMELQREDATTSLREVFYRNKHTIEGTSENTFDYQDESDPLIEDLEVTLALLREELHVRAGDTGQLIGPLTIVEGGDTIDCSRQGVGGKAVPSIVEPGYMDIKKCTADFILLIEKGTQFNRLSEDKFWRKHNCVLLTGGGQPPRGVRRLARRLHDEWKLPVYVLVDNDPWGYYIYSVVKQGSINLAFESRASPSPGSQNIAWQERAIPSAIRNAGWCKSPIRFAAGEAQKSTPRRKPEGWLVFQTRRAAWGVTASGVRFRTNTATREYE